MRRSTPAKRHRKKLKSGNKEKEELGKLPILKRYSDFTLEIKADSGAKATATMLDNNVRIYEPGKSHRSASEVEARRYFKALKKKMRG